MVARYGFVGCGGACQPDCPPDSSRCPEVAVRLGGRAWRHLSPTLRRWRAAPLHLTFAGVLGGLAQHGVGREPTLSAQEACHKRTAVE